MKETEFDIFVRNTLQDAEEPVSSRVWEGVEAGLDRRRIFPAWAWGITSVAAAAAVVLGVFLLRPATTEHSNPTISIAETPKATVPALESVPGNEEVTPIEEQVARSVSRLAHVPESAKEEVPVPATGNLPAQAEEPAAEAEEEAPAQESRVALASVQPENMPESAVEDAAEMNRLAMAEDRKESRGFSFTASGNLQGNNRGEVGSNVYRSPALFGLPTVTDGISNEQPELNFSLPFSFGAGVKYYFNSRWAVGIGLKYTYMSRTFIADYRDQEQGIYVPQTDIDNHQHWLGVPVNFYFDIINSGRWRLHTFAGGAAEFLADNDYLIHTSPKDIHYHQRGNAIQWSAAGGLGVEFRITPRMGLFLDPSIHYYFGAENQPRSLRTIQPLRMEFEAGIRFSLGNQ